MYKDLKYTGKKNSKGNSIFEGTITVTNSFDLETVEARIENIKLDIESFEKSGERVMAEIEAAKTNVEINKGVLDVIKDNVEITPDMASAAEILFRNMKIVLNSNAEADKQQMENTLTLMRKEVEDFTKLAEELKQIIINDPEQSPQGSSQEGSEEIGTNK